MPGFCSVEPRKKIPQFEVAVSVVLRIDGRLFLFLCRFCLRLIFIAGDHRLDHAKYGFAHGGHIHVSNDENQHGKGRCGVRECDAF